MLDQPSGQQHSLTMNVASVTVSRFGRLVPQVEGFPNVLRRQKVDCSCLVRSHRPTDSGFDKIALLTLDRAEQLLPSDQATA